MNLSSVEKETIIIFNEESGGKATCYTHNNKLKKRLVGLCNSNEECRVVRDFKDGAIEFEFPKQWVKVNPPAKRQYTEEQRREIAERFRKSKETKNQ
jgi:hypothetical protein